MEAKLSQLVSGKKSFFLKAIDPFFSKRGAGTLIPISHYWYARQSHSGVQHFPSQDEEKLWQR